MSVEFFQTMMGKKFYESDVPRIARALEEIAKALVASQKPEHEHDKEDRCPVCGRWNEPKRPSL